MPRRPNILILMPDQHRADCLGAAGHPVIRTPHIDRLAKEGVRFSQATTVSPVCMPARASFITGRYPHNTGIWTNSGQVPADDETFFQVLQAAGYHTAHFGKSHYYKHRSGGESANGFESHMRACEDYMRSLGFDTVHETTGPWATRKTESYMTDRWKELGLYDSFQEDFEKRDQARAKPHHKHLTHASPLPTEEYFDSYVGRAATEFVENYNDSKPMCLFVGFPGPHEPWDAPGEYATMYDPGSMPKPIPRQEDMPEFARERGDLSSMAGLDPESIGRIRANYYGKISLIDHWVGQVLSAYEARGWLDDLCVVFWSDHGEMAGDHDRLYKCSYHESSVRVPLIVRYPGQVPAGETSEALAENIDISATLLDAAGLEPSRRILGKSLLPVARGDADLRDGQLSEIRYQGKQNTMLRTRTHKLVVDGRGDVYALYDLEADPDEQKNLAGDPNAEALKSDLREQLFARLLASQDCM